MPELPTSSQIYVSGRVTSVRSDLRITWSGRAKPRRYFQPFASDFERRRVASAGVSFVFIDLFRVVFSERRSVAANGHFALVQSSPPTINIITVIIYVIGARNIADLVANTHNIPTRAYVVYTVLTDTRSFLGQKRKIYIADDNGRRVDRERLLYDRGNTYTARVCKLRKTRAKRPGDSSDWATRRRTRATINNNNVRYACAPTVLPELPDTVITTRSRAHAYRHSF